MTLSAQADRLTRLEVEIGVLCEDIQRLQRIVRHLVALTQARPGVIHDPSVHRQPLMSELRVVEQQLGIIPKGD
jgi:hypothetical protein